MKRFPFRRFLSRLAVLCLLGSLAACGAGAEAAGSGVEKLALTGGGAIYRYTAPDGQEIYLVADERQEPVLHREDVNFDGVEDVVALTRLGASNAFYDFFVWDGRQYVYATPPGQEAGLANYSLDADKGYVLSQRQQRPGRAGMRSRHLPLGGDGARRPCGC